MRIRFEAVLTRIVYFDIGDAVPDLPRRELSLLNLINLIAAFPPPLPNFILYRAPEPHIFPSFFLVCFQIKQNFFLKCSLS